MHRALKDFRIPGQNWVYADTKGNIGHTMAASVPVRNGFSGLGIFPGWDPRYTWKGYVPHNALPHEMNPSRGWIATANNAQSARYPYTISHLFLIPDRYKRIRMLIENRVEQIKQERDSGNKDAGFTLKDFEIMQADQKALWVEPFLKTLVESTSQAKLNQVEAEAFQKIQGWNLDTPESSIESSIFHYFLKHLAKNTFQPHLSETYYHLYMIQQESAIQALSRFIENENSPWFDSPDTKMIETRTDVIVNSFRQAISELHSVNSNMDAWKWGNFHTLTIHHNLTKASPVFGVILDRGPFPSGGTMGVPNPFTMQLNENMDVFFTTSQRYLHDMSKLDGGKRMLPTGNSGNFMSPHYDDQIPLLRNNQYRPFRMSEKVIRDQAEKTLVLQPAGR